MPDCSVDYSVSPRSREDLRNLAAEIRKGLDLEDVLYFPIVELLDVLEETLPGFTYSIIDDDELPANKHAETNVYTGEIRIKESVYEGARRGKGRDRMTIAHEFSHFMTLCFLGFKLSRTIGGGKPRTYEDPEWQAKCLAGELLIPHDLVRGMTADEVVEKCGVSMDAARYQLEVASRR